MKDDTFLFAMRQSVRLNDSESRYVTVRAYRSEYLIITPNRLLTGDY